jgi:hypothetical protein
LKGTWLESRLGLISLCSIVHLPAALKTSNKAKELKCCTLSVLDIVIEL